MTDKNTDTKSDFHCVVETPELYIDFTARQYTKTAPYPHIIRKDVRRAATAGGK